AGVGDGELISRRAVDEALFRTRLRQLQFRLSHRDADTRLLQEPPRRGDDRLIAPRTWFLGDYLVFDVLALGWCQRADVPGQRVGAAAGLQSFGQRVGHLDTGHWHTSTVRHHQLERHGVVQNRLFRSGLAHGEFGAWDLRDDALPVLELDAGTVL